MGKLLNGNKIGRQFWYMEDIFKNKGYRYGKVEIWRSYGLWHRSLLSKSHHKPCVRHLCKKRVKVYLKEPKNKFQVTKKRGIIIPQGNITNISFLPAFIIAFTYRRNGVFVSCKYRDVNKNFWQEEDTEKIFYGVDDIKAASDIIIVEGEIDKLSMEEAGFYNCVSVPDGAPASVSTKVFKSDEELQLGWALGEFVACTLQTVENQDTKYQYLWNCKEYLEKASRIILATDGDSPGLALAEELARRLGRERCWRVKWPKKNEVDHFKDANEVLMYLGPDVLKEVIENAELYPIQGLFNFSHYFDEIDAYYHQALGFELGVATGWRGLNGLYNVVPGELTIVTGVPNSGKSEWIDALLCNINRSVGWRFALCSMENKVVYD
ncbi:Twinkle-like protein, chloroplastic/mitochondrial [Vitis vinifera]|uniref:Twinkle-like protein, chloroplastic/mitochondrial n=1 Tax=Vitis vinifera TaxID=29760 RepID=A0A438ETJ5_VITVI|nr:Twinkle-like protein, chloroplastic/mitochondrial [Vitis vinifera]